MSSPTWAAMMLTKDLDVCDALITGIAVPRERLDTEALRRIGEPTTGPDLELTNDLVLRLEVHRPGRTARAAVESAARAAEAEASATPTAPPEPQATAAGELELVTLDAFCAVDEPGAAALVGDEDGAVIPEDGDVMFYGDGGAGKTTLCVDLACHLAAGDDWLGMTVARPARVLIVENEGPRPLFRVKLRRKRDGWTGTPLGDRVVVLAAPWGELTFAEDECRQALATAIRKHEIDVVIVGPLTRSGMNEAGTLQQVRDFMGLVKQVRKSSSRRVAVVLVHHENKGGAVSGAWEGAGDTLFHVQPQGRGRTRLYFQKTRWASAHHQTTLHLLWSDGDGFALEDKPELDDTAIAEKILAAIAENPGTGWTKVEVAIKGIGNERIRAVRDGLLRAGQIVNVVKQAGGEVALDSCPERVSAHLFPAEDPTIIHLRRASGADVAQTAPLWAEGDGPAPAPCATPIRRTAVGAEHSAPENDSVGAP